MPVPVHEQRELKSYPSLYGTDMSGILQDEAERVQARAIGEAIPANTFRM
jgi:hypothetical protein